MGLFSTKAKTSTTTNTQDVTNVDNRVGEAGAVFGGNVSVNAQGSPVGRLNITSIDAGSVAAGRDVSLAALDLVRQSQETSTAASQQQVSQAYQLAQAARQSETSGAINNFARYGAIVAGLAVLAWAYSRRKG